MARHNTAQHRKGVRYDASGAAEQAAEPTIRLEDAVGVLDLEPAPEGGLPCPRVPRDALPFVQVLHRDNDQPLAAFPGLVDGQLRSVAVDADVPVVGCEVGRHTASALGASELPRREHTWRLPCLPCHHAEA